MIHRRIRTVHGLVILSICVAIAGTVAGLAVGGSGAGTVRYAPTPDSSELSTEVNNDIRRLNELIEDLRTGVDSDGNPLEISNLDVRLLVSVMLDDDEFYDVRKWAIAGASQIVLESAVVSDLQRDVLVNALYDVWYNAECDQSSDLAHTLLSEELALVD